ncbi:U-box domain-containing protein 35 [Ziziphus jujuba]|uniref:U-box domain-containing protein 35 n=1 Tax=Ziziphus jujuba TaxID=326968 RepID=A0A6P4AF26_ZIZJJ|nr:U-box domain-containing protein 35 [Ziziphus jujuba]
MSYEIDQEYRSVSLLEADDDEEESEESESLFSIDIFRDHHHHKEDGENDRIYVAVGNSGKSKSSMDALLWTLKHAISSSSSSNTSIFLIHVFPVIRQIPSPLGMLPKSKVDPRLVENYVAKEKDKRRKLLQSYIEACSAAKVKVDTVIIESDMVSKALIDLIATLNIRKLVVGTSKSNFRKLKSKRISGVAKQIIQNAPETCDVKIICDGKEVIEHLITCSPCLHGSNASSLFTLEIDQELESPSTQITTRSPLNTSPLSGQVWSMFKRVRVRPILSFGTRKTQPNTPISL